jgi:hypothetical protein
LLLQRFGPLRSQDSTVRLGRAELDA